MKRILLFSDIPPCQNYSGGLVLKQLCSFLPEGSLNSVVVMNPQLNPDLAPELNWMPITFIDKPKDNWGVHFKNKLLSETSSFVMDTYSTMTWEREIISRVVAIAKDYQPDALWLILEGHTIIRMGEALTNLLQIPVYSLVWDPPGWWLRENRVNQFTSQKTLSRFDKLLRRSKHIATASWALAEKYQEQGAQTIPLVASLDRKLLREPSQCPHERDELIIAIAGQIYAMTEWESLLVALQNLGWRIGGKKVKIRVLSRYATMWANTATNIEFLGWRTQSETVDLLADSDILFCPYWFDPKFATESQLSYPSKLTSYFASGRPVLFLGPSFSSPAALIDKYQVGLGCYSLNISDIITSLTSLASDSQLYSSISQHAYQFFIENLTNDVLQNRFYQFLDFLA